MTAAAECFAALVLIVISLSHILQAPLWAAFFAELRKRPDAGLLVGAFTLPFGAFLVATHNVWQWDISVLTTIVGWGQTIKGTLYLLFPKMLNRVAPANLTAGKFVAAGTIGLILGATIGFGVLSYSW